MDGGLTLLWRAYRNSTRCISNRHMGCWV